MGLVDAAEVAVGVAEEGLEALFGGDLLPGEVLAEGRGGGLEFVGDAVPVVGDLEVDGGLGGSTSE